VTSISRVTLVFLAAALLSACSATGGVGPMTPQTQSAFNSAHSADGTLVIALRLPRESSTQRNVHPRYISPATKGMTLDFTGPSSLLEAVNLTSSDSHCRGTPLTCTIDVVLPAGKYTGTVSTFDQAPIHGRIPTGANLLSTARHLRFTIVQGKSTHLRLALDGVPSSIVVGGFPNASTGTALSNQPFNVTAEDADQFIIVGTYTTPISLSDSDTSGATTIATEGNDKPPKDVLRSSSDIVTITYNGKAILPVSITAKAGTIGNSGLFIVRLPIYVADAGDNTVNEIPVGCILASCVTTLGGGFSLPLSVAVNASGDVFVADTENNAVKEIPPGCTTAGCVATIGGGFTMPDGVALDESGNVYVADQSAVIKKIPPGCSSSACVTALGGGFSDPAKLALDGSGDVFVADEGNGAVKKIPRGCTSASCVATLAGGFSEPLGVAVDRVGDVFVADLETRLISEIPVSCNASVCVVSIGGGFALPVGVAVDGFGNVYVADLASSAVKVIPPGCTTANCVTTAGGGFGSPGGVAVL
jgi:NHL repeat